MAHSYVDSTRAKDQKKKQQENRSWWSWGWYVEVFVWNTVVHPTLPSLKCLQTLLIWMSSLPFQRDHCSLQMIEFRCWGTVCQQRFFDAELCMWAVGLVTFFGCPLQGRRISWGRTRGKIHWRGPGEIQSVNWISRRTTFQYLAWPRSSKHASHPFGCTHATQCYKTGGPRQRRVTGAILWRSSVCSTYVPKDYAIQRAVGFISDCMSGRTTCRGWWSTLLLWTLARGHRFLSTFPLAKFLDFVMDLWVQFSF